jgi:hypothetical protein
MIVCNFCELKKVEDEMHLIMKCLFYNQPREKLLENIREIIPSFDILTKAVQFGIIMTGLEGDYEISNIGIAFMHECKALRGII